MDPIGRIVEIWRYPVKSMTGERVTDAFVSYAGLMGDRVYAFVDPLKTDNFPWMTQRQVPQMSLYKPKFRRNPDLNVLYPSGDSFDLDVTTPGGDVFDIRDPALIRHLEETWKRGFVLRFSEKGMQDARPVSLMSFSTVKDLGREAGMEMDHRRFRMNLYVEWNNPAPRFEDSLVGKQIQIGEKLVFHILKETSRCIVTNVDQSTGQVDTRVLKAIGKSNRGKLGVDGPVIRQGPVKEGDPIFLL